MFCAQIVGNPPRTPEPAVSPAIADAPCNILRRDRVFCDMLSYISMVRECEQARPTASRSYELVPAARQIAVFVHHGVPYRDVAHPVPEGAAVTGVPGLFHQLAVGI